MSMSRPDKKSVKTLHQRIRNDIEQRIMSGRWQPGYRVPCEQDLMVDYDCSRMTVNKAISALAEEGLVVRKRRAGTFVARQRLQSVVLEIPDIQAEITRRGHVYDYRLLSRSRRAALRSLRHEMELAAGQSLLAVRCLHMAGERPFALEDRLISLVTVPEAAGIEFDEVAPGSWLLGHVPWTEAQHHIRAVNVDADAARLLEIETGTACLSLERHTWREDQRITCVKQIFPGDAYELTAQFGPAYA